MFDNRFDGKLNEALDTLRASERKTLLDVWENRDDFVKWPERSHLLWEGETRKPAKNKRFHTYPLSIRSMLMKAGIPIDPRTNGPAIAAYRLAGGNRPSRRAGKGWDIHHIYDGRFAAKDSGVTLNAVKDGKHFTQAAGLVAIHPIAHACADEYYWFAWQLRHEAFLRFGYDPDGIFSIRTNSMGFRTK